jgi:alkyldihydroxyacetonephosphate synthase
VQRWNGWGDEAVEIPLAPSAAHLLERLVGPGSATPDATLPDAVAAVAESRLPAHPLVETEPELRLRRARGQSLPDWVALRSGRLAGTIPDGVARPADDGEVRDLLGWAAEVGATVIPYGGGTSVVGGVSPVPDDGRPTLTLSLERRSALRSFDERSGLATFGAGTTGTRVEAALAARGWTLGHYPQSFEYSTVGGWVAARSSGQQSMGFGRIEALFAGGRLEAPAGSMELPPHPASAAGPDLRQLVLGSGS